MQQAYSIFAVLLHTTIRTKISSQRVAAVFEIPKEPVLCMSIASSTIHFNVHHPAAFRSRSSSGISGHAASRVLLGSSIRPPLPFHSKIRHLFQKFIAQFAQTSGIFISMQIIRSPSYCFPQSFSKRIPLLCHTTEPTLVVLLPHPACMMKVYVKTWRFSCHQTD